MYSVPHFDEHIRMKIAEFYFHNKIDIPEKPDHWRPTPNLALR